MYILQDSFDELTARSFYNKELQKIKQKVFRRKKIIRKKKINGVEHGLAKLLGYSTKFNELIPVKEIETFKKSHIYKMKGPYKHTTEENLAAGRKEKRAYQKKNAHPR